MMHHYSLSAIVDLLDRDRADDTVQRVLRAYSTRAITSEKKAPPGFFVLTDHPGNGGIEAVCVGPAWHGAGFEVEIVAEGMGSKRGRVTEARANAWAYYHECRRGGSGRCPTATTRPRT